jgi:hypothetical protein
MNDERVSVRFKNFRQEDAAFAEAIWDEGAQGEEALFHVPEERLATFRGHSHSPFHWGGGGGLLSVSVPGRGDYSFGQGVRSGKKSEGYPKSDAARMREKCQLAALSVLALRKYRQSVLSSNVADISIIIAKYVWATRGAGVWFVQIPVFGVDESASAESSPLSASIDFRQSTLPSLEVSSDAVDEQKVDWAALPPWNFSQDVVAAAEAALSAPVEVHADALHLDWLGSFNPRPTTQQQPQ